MGIFSDVLFTADFDRTLTAPDSSVPQRNIEAIRYFMENGGTFTVNTGRSVPMTRFFRDIVPVNAPLLLYNGSAAYDPRTGALSQLHTINLDMWETVRTCMALFPDLTVEVQGIEAHYRFTENPAWDAFSRRNQCEARFAKPGDDLGPFLKFTVYGAFHDDTVASLFSGTPEEMERMDGVFAILTEKFGKTCELFRAAPRIIDVHAKGVSKAKSARELQRQLGKKILVCAGDAENDILMMQDADYAFCPADSYLTSRFPAVCPCGEGAVADVIYEKIPEILKKA